MGRTIRTVAIMLLAPPALLYALAHAGAFDTPSALAHYALLVSVWAIGMAALARSRWPLDVKLVAGLAYSLAAVFALPLLALLAVCSTGDCL